MRAAQLFNRIGQIGLGVALVGQAVIFDRFSGVKKNVEDGGTHFFIAWMHLSFLMFVPDLEMFLFRLEVAQQHAEKARFLMVEKAEQTRKATVMSAGEDAQAAILLAKPFGDSDEGLVELRRVEAAEDIASPLSRSRHSKLNACLI
ncbi:prohibitin [Holotrichia oblita]|uniref:Prohibitin n=1 Tax=Holotrichia oblita TaxID=644536 RepID=A0ACB9SIG6_HOLOL|nr:prohibitin [Holotrichia oblita]